MNGIGGEFSAQPLRLANPGNTSTNRVKFELFLEAGFRRWVTVVVADNGNTIEGNATITLLWG